jgi:hypothetical protein
MTGKAFAMTVAFSDCMSSAEPTISGISHPRVRSAS